MKQITLKIEAGKDAEIAVTGDYIRIKTASVAVRIRDENSDVDATIEQGDALNLRPFNRIRVSHSDGAEQTITLLIGNGTSSDSARVGGSVTVSSLPADSLGVVHSRITPWNGQSPVLASNPGRKLLMIQNQDPSLSMWFRFDGGVASNSFGIKLNPGESLLFDKGCPTGQVLCFASAVCSANALQVVEG